MTVEFQYDGTVADDEAHFAEPWFEQTACCRCRKEMQGHLERDWLVEYFFFAKISAGTNILSRKLTRRRITKRKYSNILILSHQQMKYVEPLMNNNFAKHFYVDPSRRRVLSIKLIHLISTNIIILHHLQ